MNRKYIITVRSSILLLFILAIIFQSCDRGPTAGFRIEPLENPEAGDTIFFINESIDATAYEWDFDNGETSESEIPFTYYEKSGEYTVFLNAINDKGNDTISKNLVINDPTVMAFLIFEDDSVTPLNSCGIWIYTDQDSWDNFDEPDFYQLTDSDGYAEFLNMEDINYYIWILKEIEDGVFISGGYTEPLSLNEINFYAIAVDFVPNEPTDEPNSLKSVLKSKRRAISEQVFSRQLNR